MNASAKLSTVSKGAQIHERSFGGRRQGASRLILTGWLALAGPPAPADAAEHAGRGIAEQYCATCHLFPEPDLLSRDDWRRTVLPAMGARLGITAFRGEAYVPDGQEEISPALALAEWAAIYDYYIATAPVSLPYAAVEAEPDLELFDVEQPRSWSRDWKGTTSLLIDEESRLLVVGDAANNRLVVYSSDLDEIASIGLTSPPAHISRFDTDYYIVTQIGSIVPSEELQGTIESVRLRDGIEPEVAPLLRSMPRPVQSIVSDFDSDGRQDILVAAFGHQYLGELAMHLQTVPGVFTRKVLVEGPGAVSVRMVPKPDGEFDLYALFAQGDERILRISGAGVVETLMRFPPSYGSVGLDVLDFDDDGDLDLLYVSGDNGDVPGWKPYHGVSLFRNEGGRYDRVLFFPMHGAYGARAEDFDGDGDRDIAAIAFFGDYRNDPDAAGFVFLENLGDLRFRPRTISGIGALGRFIAIADGDIDGDGDIDLALGSFTAVNTPWAQVPDDLAARWATAPAFVVLRNRANQAAD